MIDLGNLTRATDGSLHGQLRTFGQCVDIQVTPQEGFLPDQIDYKVFWDGLCVGQGETQVDPASGYQSIVLRVAQPQWGERPLKITVLHVPAILAPETHRMIWRPQA